MLAIVETAMDGLLAVDERWIVRWANPSARRMFGYAPHELAGLAIDDLYADAPPAVSDGPVEVRGRRKDGSIFPMELTLGHTTIAGERYTSAVVRDITERRLLEREVLEASDELQTRIGRDLHDGLGQLLTGIALIAQGMENELPAPQSAKAARIVALINEAIRTTRDLARGLCPISMSDRTLESALHELCRSSGEVFGVACSFEHTDAFVPPGSVIGTQLYLIAREAITNAVRHGQATHIDVSASTSGGESMLCVRNDGADFRPDAFAGPGLGVRSMRYRARMIGGTLDIRPRQGGGTIVVCRWAS